eukprot:3426504-Rhodomonas_salina.2
MENKCNVGSLACGAGVGSALAAAEYRYHARHYFRHHLLLYSPRHHHHHHQRHRRLTLVEGRRWSSTSDGLSPSNSGARCTPILVHTMSVLCLLGHGGSSGTETLASCA